MTYLWLILSAVFAGYGFACVEAAWRKDRIANKDRRKLPHGWLLLARIAFSAVMVVLSHGIAHLAYLLFVPTHFIVLTIVHRVVYNLASGQHFYYMGSPHRTKGDSIYDTIMWIVPIHVWDFLCRITRRWPITLHPSVPFILANTIEGTVLCLLIRHLP